NPKLAMRAVCLLILISLEVFSIQCQNVPGDTGAETPTLEEVLERAESQLLRSFLEKQEDDESAN
ncbi:thyrotropin releasing hormone, partial [Clarias magur]